jgi:hypothetical protein
MSPFAHTKRNFSNRVRYSATHPEGCLDLPQNGFNLLLTHAANDSAVLLLIGNLQ